MRLRVRLPRMAALDPDSVLRFEVLDAARRIVRRGESVAAALPADLPLELVLHGDDALVVALPVPRLSGPRLAAVLPGLVEDRVLEDTDRLHVVSGPRDGAGRALVAATDRALLERALAIFRRAGRRVISAVPASFALPEVAGGWRVRCAEGEVVLRAGEAGFSLEPTAGALPAELALLRARSGDPAVVEVEGEGDVASWADALATTVRRVGEPDRAVLPALELLQHALAPEPEVPGRWRRTGALTALLMLAAAGGLVAHAAVLRAEERALRARMAAVVQAAFPQVPVVLEPLAQMRRLAGEPAAAGGSGFTALALALGESLPADSLEELAYESGRLTATLRATADDPRSRAAAVSAAAARVGATAAVEGRTVRLVAGGKP